MQVLVVKDSATKIAKDVTLDQAQAYVAQGMEVLVVVGEGQTLPLGEWEALQPAVDVEEKPSESAETATQATPAKAKPAAKKTK